MRTRTIAALSAIILAMLMSGCAGRIDSLHHNDVTTPTCFETNTVGPTSCCYDELDGTQHCVVGR